MDPTPLVYIETVGSYKYLNMFNIDVRLDKFYLFSTSYVFSEQFTLTTIEPPVNSIKLITEDKYNLVAIQSEEQVFLDFEDLFADMWVEEPVGTIYKDAPELEELLNDQRIYAVAKSNTDGEETTSGVFVLGKQIMTQSAEPQQQTTYKIELM